MTSTDTTRPDHQHEDQYDDEIGDLLTLAEVAILLRVPEATLRYWRHCDKGPVSYKIGRHIRYRRHDVHTWLRGQRNHGSHDVA
jgi:excisionase family DNA binding protein